MFLNSFSLRELSDEHFAGFGAIGGADDSFALHLLDHARGSIVAYLHVTLDKGYRCLPQLAYQRHRLIIFFIVAVILFVRLGGIKIEFIDRRIVGFLRPHQA